MVIQNFGIKGRNFLGIDPVRGKTPLMGRLPTMPLRQVGPLTGLMSSSD